MADIQPTVTKPWLSKTLIFNLLVAGSAFIPGVSGFVQSHADAVLMGLGVVNMILRLVTKDKIGLSE